MKLNETNIFVVDTETTGLDPAKDGLVEIAMLRCKWEGNGDLDRGGLFTTLVNPGIHMPAQAQAIHHINDADVREARSPVQALEWASMNILPGPNLIVAHNAPFDRGFLPSFDSWPWLCTKRFAQHVFSDAPAFNNQVLRYYLELKVDLAGMLPHRAAADVLVTAALLERLLRISPIRDDVEKLIEYVDSPVLLQKMPFGKHFGTAICDVPEDYLRWALHNMSDLDPDVKHTFQTEIMRRRNG